MKRAALTTAALLALGLFASSANAAVNLVTNPGFETGDFTGWTDSDVFVHNFAGAAHSGNSSVNFSDPNPFGSVSQNIPTVAGHTYQIDYYVRSDIGGQFYASWDNSTIVGTNIDNISTPYTLYSFQLPATSSSTTIAFFGYNNFGQYNLDDVSVIDVTPVPEPASFSLLAIGALALLRRRSGSARQ